MSEQATKDAVLPEFKVDDPRSGVAHLQEFGLKTTACTVLRARDDAHWLATRSPFIGSSEVAVLFDIAPAKWKRTKLALYASKVKGIDEAAETEEEEEREDDAVEQDDEPDYGPEKEWLEVGRYLEPSISLMAEKMIDRKNGLRVMAPPPFITFRSMNVPFLGSTPDRFTVENGELRVLELKSADFFARADWMKAGTDGKVWILPNYYEAQVQAQLFVLGLKRARVAALIGRKFVHFEVERNTKFIAKLIELAASFWTLVEKRTPPPATAADYGVIKQLFPEPVRGEECNLGDFGQEILEQWEAANERIKLAKANIDGWRVQIAERMKTAEIGNLPDGRHFTFATANATRVSKVVRAALDTIAAAKVMADRSREPTEVLLLALDNVQRMLRESATPRMARSLRKPLAPRSKVA